jgi:hypothetical protein
VKPTFKRPPQIATGSTCIERRNHPFTASFEQ